MRVQVKKIWSPDLDPTDGYPKNKEEFNVTVAVELYEKSWVDPQLFYLTVISPSKIAKMGGGFFIKETLVLNTFSWIEIREKIEKLLIFCGSASSFEDVEKAISGYLKYGD